MSSALSAWLPGAGREIRIISKKSSVTPTCAHILAKVINAPSMYIFHITVLLRIPDYFYDYALAEKQLVTVVALTSTMTVLTIAELGEAAKANAPSMPAASLGDRVIGAC